MKNKKRKAGILIGVCISILMTLSACGSSQDEFDEFNLEQEVDEDTIEGFYETDAESELEDGMFYVRHANGKNEPVYFGNATFSSGKTSSEADDGRVMWFKDDFENIPTLYEGDSLIYYTKEVLNEKFNYERFEDLGYSLGLCGLKETKSKRFEVSTNVEDNCTYPNGDTDAILSLENEIVLLDSIGGTPLRATTDEAKNYSYLTRVGSLSHLQKDNKYNVTIYEGTIRHEYTFTADVKILGSMDVYETYDYVFRTDNVMQLQIPEHFHSGYYLINGIGLFRYVVGNEYTETTDFNVANIDPSKQETSTVTYTEGMESIAEIASVSKDTEFNSTAPRNDKKSSTFNVIEPGEITVYITFTIKNNLMGDGMPDVSATIISPKGTKYKMLENNEGLYLTFDAEDIGTYTINYEDLDVRIPNVVIATE